MDNEGQGALSDDSESDGCEQMKDRQTGENQPVDVFPGITSAKDLNDVSESFI